jgi:pimeloyl-ACP methyl ester carboxylesterase
VCPIDDSSSFAAAVALSYNHSHMNVLALAALATGLASQVSQLVLTDRTFSISGISLHIRCGGAQRTGVPVVVLEAGGGNSADTWKDVQAPIAEFARVCAYDRPGLGTSTSPDAPLSADAHIQLMSALLKAAGEQGPYILVGHSIGGVIAALYANANPRDVVGMVLVDSSHEQVNRRFREARVESAAPSNSRVFIEALAKKPWRGTIPLVVLTRGKPPAIAARHPIWLELQRDWVTRSPNAKHIIAANSGHYIHNDEPHLVVNAVRSVVEQALVSAEKRPTIR